MKLFKLKQRQKRVLTGIVSLGVFLNIFLYFGGNTTEYSDAKRVEQILLKNCEAGNQCIVPIQWYNTNGWMQPSVAGAIDGAYEMGYSVKELSEFIVEYALRGYSFKF